MAQPYFAVGDSSSAANQNPQLQGLDYATVAAQTTPADWQAASKGQAYAAQSDGTVGQPTANPAYVVPTDGSVAAQQIAAQKDFPKANDVPDKTVVQKILNKPLPLSIIQTAVVARHC